MYTHNLSQYPTFLQGEQWPGPGRILFGKGPGCWDSWDSWDGWDGWDGWDSWDQQINRQLEAQSW